MPTIILWYAPGACSLAPHIVLREAGIEFEVSRVEFQNGRLPDETIAINPKGQVPILGIDSNIITENTAILTAIPTLAGAKNLLGTNDLDRIRVYEWLSWIGGTLHAQAYGAFFRPIRFTDDPALFDAVRKRGRDRILDCYGEIERKLNGIYAVGDRLTVVDPYLYVFWRWGKQNDFDMEKNYPKYSELAYNVLKRDATKAALIEEGLNTQGVL